MDANENVILHVLTLCYQNGVLDFF